MSIYLTDSCTPWHGVEVERLTDHCSYRVWKHHILLRIADTQGGGIKSYFSVTSRIRKTEFSYILVIKLNNQMKKLLMISIIFTLLLVANFSILLLASHLPLGERPLSRANFLSFTKVHFIIGFLPWKCILSSNLPCLDTVGICQCWNVHL